MKDEHIVCFLDIVNKAALMIYFIAAYIARTNNVVHTVDIFHAYAVIIATLTVMLIGLVNDDMITELKTVRSISCRKLLTIREINVTRLSCAMFPALVLAIGVAPALIEPCPAAFFVGGLLLIVFSVAGGMLANRVGCSGAVYKVLDAELLGGFMAVAAALLAVGISNILHGNVADAAIFLSALALTTDLLGTIFIYAREEAALSGDDFNIDDA